jgi:hypothetical protein
MIPTVTLSPVSSARNLGVLLTLICLYLIIFLPSSNLVFLSHVRDLRRHRPILDQSTTRNIATALIHSKLEYCNLFLNLPANQLDGLQLVLNFAAHAVTNPQKFHHIIPILNSLHRLKISERIHSKLLSIA